MGSWTCPICATIHYIHIGETKKETQCRKCGWLPTEAIDSSIKIRENPKIRKEILLKDRNRRNLKAIDEARPYTSF